MGKEKRLLNEKDLLEKIAGGDQASFALLFDHYHGYVYTVAFRLLRSTAPAEEVVQDVFVKIWQKRELLPQVDFFHAFLARVAQNIIYPAIRKEAIKQKHEGLFISSIGFASTYTDIYADKEYAAILHHAVTQLPDKQKQTYLLIKEEGLKREQVAARLQVSPETVKSNLDQAMKNIRAYCKSRAGVDLMLLLLVEHFI